jgi:hypothetical protein
MSLIVLILVLLILFGGVGFYAGPRYGWGYPHYGGLGFVLVLLIVLLLVFGPWPHW